jgi:cytochrome c
MLNKSKFIEMGIPVIFGLFAFGYFPFSKENSFALDTKVKIENHPPVVKIVSPQNNSAYALNSMVAYEISVSDEEDGESKYDEINPKEIFLEIKYLKNAVDSIAQRPIKEDVPGLAIIKKSNCMNCHFFKTKLIGPSFYDITRRYAGLAHIQDTLAAHILKGSKGRWGDVQMPSNTQLNRSQAQEVIQWIFNNATDSTVDYIAGAQGSFRLHPPDTYKNALLIASYTDHGSKEEPGKALKGQDVVLIHVK